MLSCLVLYIVCLFDFFAVFALCREGSVVLVVFLMVVHQGNNMSLGPFLSSRAFFSSSCQLAVLVGWLFVAGSLEVCVPCFTWSS